MKKYIKYIVTFLIALIIAIILMATKNVFVETDTKTLYKNLVDAFFVPGIIIFCFGILVFTSNEGTFDMLSYGVRRMFDVFKREKIVDRYKTFYEYRQAKREHVASFGYLMITGLVFIVISIILLIIYYQI